MALVSCLYYWLATHSFVLLSVSPWLFSALHNHHRPYNPIALPSFRVAFCTVDLFDWYFACHPLRNHHSDTACHALHMNGLLIFVVAPRFHTDPMFIKLKPLPAKRATKFTAPWCNLVEMITGHGLIDPAVKWQITDQAVRLGKISLRILPDLSILPNRHELSITNCLNIGHLSD